MTDTKNITIDDGQTIYAHPTDCPDCGSECITNSRVVWCGSCDYEINFDDHGIRTYSTDSPQDAFEDLVLERNAQRRKTRYQFLTEGQTVKFRDMTKSVKDVSGQLEKTTVTVRFL